MRIVRLGMAAVVLGLAMPALADVKAGVEAWSRGDYKTAVDEWRGPAVAGDADAQFNMGQAYKLGRGVPVDAVMAESWYRRAAEQGHAQAEDNYGLALFQNNKRDQAVPWLEKSSARGEPRAQYVLGTMFFNGDGVKRDLVRAYALMTRAAASDLPQAKTTLGQMDQYIRPTERQRGTALARQYEADARRGIITTTPVPPSKPVEIAAAPPPPPPPKPRATPAAPAPAPRVTDGGWRVQLGAFGDPNNARKLWGQVGSRFPGRQPYFVKAGNLTRLLVGPFGSQAEASRGCAGVSPCVPTRG